jgi:hypothetical protein
MPCGCLRQRLASRFQRFGAAGLAPSPLRCRQARQAARDRLPKIVGQDAQGAPVSFWVLVTAGDQWVRPRITSPPAKISPNKNLPIGRGLM